MSKAARRGSGTKRKPTQAKYSESLLTYYDILGFREMIDGKKRKRRPEEIAKILRGLRDMSGLQFDPCLMESFAFSDTIVRARGLTPIDGGADFPNALVSELIGIALAQMVLTRDRVIIRGSVTIGRLHFSRGIVFGPALVRAHEIAEKVAVYPRVVLDPQILHKCDSAGCSSQTAEHFGPLLREDTDGLYYVDYLRYFGKENGPKPPLLEEHRSMIIEKGSDCDCLDRKSAKINWLAHYHNSTVNAYSEETLKKWGCSRADLLVPLDAIKTTYDLGEGA